MLLILGDCHRLDALDVRQIELFLSKKKEEASEWTARKYYIHLASAFQSAIRWNYLSVNPFRKVQKPRMKEHQPVYFNRDEFQKLQSAIDDEQYRNISLVGIFTGMRLGEILNLQWADVNLSTKVIQVRNSAGFTTKTKRNRSLSMNEQLVHLFQVMSMSTSSELVFHNKGKRLAVDDISRRFKPYIRKARLREELHFHSLRHTFASWLVQDGVSLYEVQKLLGHSSSAVTQAYSHLQPETLHTTVNRISLALN